MSGPPAPDTAEPSAEEAAPLHTAAPPSGVRARLLGPPQLALGDRNHALERKDAALLALLALEGPTSRGHAATLLWPQAGSDRARSNLRQRLHRMRRQAGQDLVQGSETLQLAAMLAHDLRTPRSQLEHDPHALDGELLGTLDYADCHELAAWVDSARQRWRLLRREARAALAAEFERQGRLAAALAAAELLVRDEPAFEAAHRMLMRLHLRRGDRAAALAAYERCRTALIGELGAGVAPDAQTRELHSTALRGATDTTAAAPRPEAVAVLRPPRLVGREPEWAQVGAAWAARKVVVLAGEPGIGKTRLVAEFAAASAGCIVVGGRPGDAHDAYALLTRLLRELLPRVGAPLPPWLEAQLALLLPERGGEPAPSWNPLRLRQALAEVISRTGGDVGGVLVDDVQFCDVASLELLTTVCMEPAMARNVGAPNWLFAVRAGEVPAMFATWVSAADRERLYEVRLGPLDPAGMQALVGSLALPGLDAAAVSAALHERTGGNPMFALETLRMWPAGSGAPWQAAPGGTLSVPPRVGELLERRLAQLGASARALAQVAALAGQDFDAALAAEVLACHALDLADPWRELEVAQVIRDAAFAHDLVFEAARRSVPEVRAVELHARIAARLDRHAGEPARIAWHWQGARQWVQAGHAFAAAAARLRSRVRRDEEAALLEQADACFERAGEHEARSEALLFLFRSHWDRKYRAGIREIAARMQAVARTPAARLWAAWVQAQLATDERPDEASLALVVAVRESTEQYLRDADAALLAADAAAPSGTRVSELLTILLIWEATVLAILNRLDDALRAASRVAGMLNCMPRDRWRGHNHFNAGFTFEVCGELAAALDQFDLAEQIFVALDEPVHIADTRSMSSVTLFHLGRLAEATRRLEAGRRTWADVNGGRAEPHTSDVYIARYWREAGRLGAALAVLVEAVERAARIADANLHGWAAGELAGLYLLLGQPARAAPLLALARAAPKPHVRFDGLLAEARLARALGDSAQRALEEARALVPSCMRAERLGWLLDVERARSMPAGEAAALMRSNFEAASARQAWAAAAPSQAMWIDALTRAGDATGAALQARALARWLSEAGANAPTLERPAMTLYAAEYWLILQRAFTAAGDDAAARDAARRGAAWIEQVVLPDVPDEFRDSFLHRNPVNRALLALAPRPIG